jgi:hypothetical protein
MSSPSPLKPLVRQLAGAAACILLVLLTSSTALAGAPRYHEHTFTISTAACPTGEPGQAPDGVDWGISLSGLRGFKATVCPAAGHALTGAGSIKVCTYSARPWGPGSWALSELAWDFTGLTSTVDNPCRELTHLMPVVALSDRVFLYPSTDFGVSGGTTLTVHLVGELR